MKRKIFRSFVIAILLILIASFLILPSWTKHIFGQTTYEQILYNITAKPEKGNLDILGQYFTDNIIIYLVFILIAIGLIYISLKSSKKQTRVLMVTIIIGFIVSLVYLLNGLGVPEYLAIVNKSSTIYEDEYINPKNVEIDFPNDKRNLILITLESMDTSFEDYLLKDGSRVNLIPGLSKVAKENTSFKQDSKPSGMQNVTNTTWTAASLIAQSSGVPLLEIVDINFATLKDEFMPGLVTLGDILEDQGYNNYFIMGSDASFGSRDLYYKKHGNYELYDLKYQKEVGRLPEDYMVFWGYEDSKMFEYAKEDLIRISKGNKPFNYNILTANTHFMEGHVDEGNKEKYGGYADAYYYSDKEVTEFINWVKEQEFYKNTTIVLVGDHRTMNASFLRNQGNERRLYNTYINPYKQADNLYREFTVLDTFPTIISAIGGNIKGDRLGLGSDLFSDTETLVEKYGIDELNYQLRLKSDYYKKEFLE